MNTKHFYLIENQKTYKNLPTFLCPGETPTPNLADGPRLYAVELLGCQLTNLNILYGKMKRAF
jgi:hypothetical protein